MCARFPLRAGVLAVAALAACNSPTDPTDSPDALPLLLIEPSNVTLPPGGRLKLAVTVREAEPRVRSSSDFVWSSTDDQVATVTANGMVTANGNGSAQITVYWEGHRAFATVRVFTRTTPARCGRLVSTSPPAGADERLVCRLGT